MANDSVKIWNNNFKKDEKHPDFTAQNVEINGIECDVSVWMNTGKNGKPYLSMTTKPPYKEKEVDAAQADHDLNTGADDDSELPF